jgi:hypothetical protein
MLKKSFTLGLLAAGLMIAPTAVLADQISGSNTVIQQSSVTSGSDNVTGQSADSFTIQRQLKSGYPVCFSGNQVAGANTGIGQASVTIGEGNVTGQSASAVTIQGQSSNCSAYPYIYLP